MSPKSRKELYKDFLEFVTQDMQAERSEINRRILSVFLWCFIVPVLASGTILLLIRLGILPRRSRNQADLLVLVFPVFYSMYFLSSQVLPNLPTVFRRGGVASILDQSILEGNWRDQVCESMGKVVLATPSDWEWILASFEMDLKALRHRTRHLTALAGAVFYLLIRGIDAIGEIETQPIWTKSPIFGWVDTSSDLSQFVGLALFLVLLYLSGSQTNRSLHRYLNCVSLMTLLSKEGMSKDSQS